MSPWRVVEGRVVNGRVQRASGLRDAPAIIGNGLLGAHLLGLVVLHDDLGLGHNFELDRSRSVRGIQLGVLVQPDSRTYRQMGNAGERTGTLTRLSPRARAPLAETL